jgi:hypothetical protein
MVHTEKQGIKEGHSGGISVDFSLSKSASPAEAGERLVSLARESASGAVTWSETLSYVEASDFYNMTPPF